MHGWSLREVARASGRSPAQTSAIASAGLLPGYVGRERQRAEIPAELAEPFATVLRDGCYSPRFAELVRTDPHRALAAVEALATLVRASLEPPLATSEQLTLPEEAA